MVHAVGEIRRVLVPGGTLIDVRPILDRWRIDVSSAREVHETGRVKDFPIGLADDRAANRAIAQAAADGWFVRQQEDFFLYSYSWDTPGEMEEWIEAEWEDFIAVEEETKRATRSVWATADADSQVQLRVKILITKWEKL